MQEPTRSKCRNRACLESLPQRGCRASSLSSVRLRSFTEMDQSATTSIDRKMMTRCIELSRTAGRLGEFPFAALVWVGGTVIAEGVNHVIREADVTRHAELIAISETP